MTGNGKAVVQEQEVEQVGVAEVGSAETASSTVPAPTPSLSGDDPAQEGPTLARAAWPQLSDGLKIGVVTLTGYFVTLAHQSGYNAVFGIPDGLIDATPQAMYQALFPMSLGFALMALFARIAWTKSSQTSVKFWKELLGTIVYALMGGVATFGLVPNAPILVWCFHAFLTACPFLPFLVVDGTEHFTKKPSPIASRAWLMWVGAFGFMIWSYLMAFWLGAGQARNREVFPILPGSQPKVLLTIRGDTWVTAPLVGPNRIAWPLTLFKPSEGERLRVQPQAVGPLKVGTSP